MKNKKADMNFMMMMLVVALIIAVVLIFTTTSRLFSGNEVIGSTVDPQKIELCNNRVKSNLGSDYNPDVHDYDNDGIADLCDICVLKLTEEEFDGSGKSSLKEKLTEDGRARAYDSFSDNDFNNNDIDKDGILDGCDSDLTKKGKVLMGSKDKLIISECNKLAKKYSDFLKADIDEREGYPLCHLVQS